MSDKPDTMTKPTTWEEANRLADFMQDQVRRELANYSTGELTEMLSEGKNPLRGDASCV